MVQHLQQPAKATLNKHIWNILPSWNFEEHQHPPHPTDNISPPQHPATISHSILRPRPFSAPGLTLGAHHGHGASGRLDPTFQHHIITSEVKSKEERKLATEPPGSGLSATRENNNHHQAKRKFLQAHVGDCWRLVVTGALVFSHSTRSQNLGIWRAGKTYDILEVAGDETQDPTWIGKDHLCTWIQLHHAASGTSTIIEHWQYRPMDTQCVRFECPDHQVQLIATPKSRCGKGRLEVGIYDSGICCIWMYPQNSKSNTKVLHNTHFSLPIWCI